MSAEQTTESAVGFTPGPWAYDDTMDGCCWNVGCTVNGCHESHPTGVFQIDGPEWDPEACDTYQSGCTRNEADAALISAAPDLYEALSDLVEIIERAGISNLANGVQLGQMSWAINAGARMRWAKTVLAAATAPLQDGTNGTSTAALQASSGLSRASKEAR